MAEAIVQRDITREDQKIEAQPVVAVAQANPAPLGLAAFAMTTFVLMFVDAGFIGGSSVQVVLGLALAYGGLAQLLAGMWEFRNGNTFGATAFTSFGAFWISYALIVFVFLPGLKAADAPGAVGTFDLAWGIFTTYMWIATIRHAWPTMVVFFLLAVTFYILALGTYQSNDNIIHVGAYVGILTAIAAWYASASTIINEAFGRKILPN